MTKSIENLGFSTTYLYNNEVGIVILLFLIIIVLTIYKIYYKLSKKKNFKKINLSLKILSFLSC